MSPISDLDFLLWNCLNENWNIQPNSGFNFCNKIAGKNIQCTICTFGPSNLNSIPKGWEGPATWPTNFSFVFRNKCDIELKAQFQMYSTCISHFFILAYSKCSNYIHKHLGGKTLNALMRYKKWLWLRTLVLVQGRIKKWQGRKTFAVYKVMYVWGNAMKLCH